MNLSNYSQGRNNNFNLIRIIAAIVVMVSHSFTLATGTVDVEPFKERLGMTIGSMAVDVFFITSGFLVTSSLLIKQSIIEFVWARVLRILPALLVMLFLTVFVLGVYFTSLPILAYFSNPRTYLYLAKGSTLFFGVIHDLPGVFDNNPYKNVVNGSLWTLPCEVWMYSILIVLWLTLQISQKDRLKAFKLAIIIFAISSGIYILFSRIFFQTSDGMRFLNHFARLFFMFFSGSIFYIVREHIFLSKSLFWFMVIVLSSGIWGKDMFYVLYTFSIPYLLFYLAYVPSGFIRKYNMLGDYSYGIYIYAFPVQQSVVALIPGVSVLQMILVSTVATILLSASSWYFFEQPFLGMKTCCIEYTKKMFRCKVSGN